MPAPKRLERHEHIYSGSLPARPRSGALLFADFEHACRDTRDEMENLTLQLKDMLTAHTEQLVETQEATKDMKAVTEILELQMETLQEHLVQYLARKVDEAIPEAIQTRRVSLRPSHKVLLLNEPERVGPVTPPLAAHQDMNLWSCPQPENEEADGKPREVEPTSKDLSNEETQEVSHGDLPGQVPEIENVAAGIQRRASNASMASMADDEEKPEEEEGHIPPRRQSIVKRVGGFSKAVSMVMNRGRPSKAMEQRSSDMSFQDLKEMYGISKRSSRRSVQKLGWFRKKCFDTAQHARFEPACSLVMMLCALGIGAEAHHSMQPNAEAEKDLKLFFRTIDLIFNGCFTVELIIRLSAEGIHFLSCHNSAVRWNYMDLSLVSIAWLQEIIEGVNSLMAVSGDGEGGISISSLRLLRMLRLVRVARILRVVRFFSELRVMVNGILGSAKSLLWAFLLLVLVMFSVGVGLMQFAAMYLNGEDVKPETAEGLRQYYGGILRTLLTLYMSISGGIDWQDAVIPLREISIFLELLFVGYAFFTIFCCLNIVTGIFVDNAKILKQADEEAMFQEALQERRRWITEVAELFNKVDEGTSGEFTFDQFKAKMRDIRVQTIFRKLGINTDTTSPEELWDILDTDQSGQIDQEEFANGIKHFHGDAKSIDVYRLRRDMERNHTQGQAKMDSLTRAISSIGFGLQHISLPQQNQHFSLDAAKRPSTASGGETDFVADHEARKNSREGLRAAGDALGSSPPRPEDDLSPRPPSKHASPNLFSP